MPALAEDIGAPWHNTMLELAGQGIKEYPGGEDNPVILGFARHIGEAFPAHAQYAANYTDDEIAWCGVTMAEGLARNGIEPPFGTKDTDRWMWGDSFSREFFADKLEGPRRGAIAVFNWNSGGNHVGTLDAWDLNGKWVDIVGGNQSNAVTRARFIWDGQLKGFYWPKKLAAAQAPDRTPADVRRRMGTAITLAEARLDAQGHVAVFQLPAGDGGGSYEVAGINERYHPQMAAKLRRMIEVEHAPDQAVRDAIGDYTGAYTDVADVWTSSWAIESYLRDSVFHRGPTGAAIIMQLALKRLGEDLGQSGPFRDGIDGEVGPLTAAAMRRQERDPARFLEAMRWAREFYERNGHQYIKGGPNRDESSQFWRGLVNRWNNQLVVARRFDAEQPKGPVMPTSDQPQQPVPPPQQPPQIPPQLPDFTSVGVDPNKMQDVLQIAMVAMLVIQMMQGKQVQVPTIALPPPPSLPPTPPQPTQPPSVPVTDAPNRGTDLWAKILGFVTLLGAGAGQMTGVAPVLGPEAGPIAPWVAGGGVAALVGGILGIFNPTLGGIVRTFGGALAGARAANKATPVQNPPTR